MLLIIILVSCKEDDKINVDKNKETEILKQLEYNAIDAEFKMDTASISKVMDDGFISITANEVTTKQKELADLYNSMYKRKLANHMVDSFYFDDFRADFFDNTAVVTFFTVTKGINNDTAYHNRRTRFYDVWTKKDGDWKLISMQATRINY